MNRWNETWNNKNRSIIILFMILSVITPFVPAVLGILLIAILLYMIKDIPLHKCNYYLFIGVVISGFLGPYLALPAFPSFFLFRILIILHMVLFLFEKKDFKKLEPVKIPLILFIVWILYSIFSLLWTGSASLSLPAIYYQIESFYLVFAFVYYMDSFAKLKQILTWILIVYVLTIFIGLWEALTGNHLIYSAGNILSYGDTRPTGLLVNTNDYSSYLAFYVPALFLALFHKKTFFKTLIGIGALGVLVFLIFETESRSGLLAFSIVVILMLYKMVKQKIIFFFGLVMGSLVGAIILIAKHGEQLTTYFTGKVNSTDQRMFMYETIYRLCKEHYFLGVGIGVTPKYVFTALYGTSNIPVDMQQTMSAHNLWLSNLSDVGVIGFFPFVVLFFWLVAHALKLYVTSKHLLATIPICILVAFFAISIGSSSIFEMRVVWLGMGLALTIICLLEKNLELGGTT
ncbi:O-antigen ligase family protein [Listeria weihenstephanensis]|uniref:O-antigen ligase family protein n=1 Tax=Listeria weihenstephanensis TaxID=1006155 RepID=A0A841Z1R2_9LIST|nr:O-antigen ligase family protein [Listeria weihenstephanensis]MBC1499128.1 O-antigen ligase family protein [Listeria weihenstephanensis]